MLGLIIVSYCELCHSLRLLAFVNKSIIFNPLGSSRFCRLIFNYSTQLSDIFMWRLMLITWGTC